MPREPLNINGPGAMLELTPSSPAVPPSPPALGDYIRHYFEVFKGGWRLIAISISACLVLAVAYLAVAKRMYEATSQLQIIRQGGRPLRVANDDPMRNLDASEDQAFIQTQMAVLQSPHVVGGAIEAIGPEKLPTLGAKGRTGSVTALVRQAQRYLKVTRPDRNALILKVAYRAGSPGEAVQMVDGIVKSYEEYLQSRYSQDNLKVVSLISKARDELGREIEDLQEKYKDFQKDHSHLLDSESNRSFIRSRLVELDRAENEALVRALQLKSQLELGKNLAKGGAEMWSITHSIAQLGPNPGNNQGATTAIATRGNTSEYVLQLIKQQQEMIARHGPQYSKVREIQEEIDEIQDRSHASLSRVDRHGTEQLLSSYEQSLGAIETMRAEIRKQFQSNIEGSRKDLLDAAVGDDLRDSLARRRALFHSVVDQLKQAQLGGDYSSVGARPIEAANAGDGPVQPGITFTLSLALMAGCVLGTGAALLADGMDVRVRSVEELEDISGFDVLGTIPPFAAGQVSGTNDAGLIGHWLPRSLPAEGYKALRTSLEMLRRGRRVQVLMITSPGVGDGKTTTASNLGISMAHGGRKVLLVDADLRSPALSGIHNKGDHAGLADILEGHQSFAEVVQHTSVRNLDLVASGPEVPNPAELLMSPRLEAFLDEARLAYDVVIIDSSPLLHVTDPSIVGTLVDGILLVVRGSQINRHDSARAADLLRLVGTSVLGTVVNGYKPGWGRLGQGYGANRYSTAGRSRPAPAYEGARSWEIEALNGAGSRYGESSAQEPGDRSA